MRQVNFYKASNFISDNSKLIKSIKITSMQIGNFNNMEGYQFLINVKLFTDDKHKNCLFTLSTNSNYMDDFIDDETGDNGKTNLEEYLNYLLD